MRVNKWKLVLILAFSPLLLLCGQALAQSPTITGLSPTSGPVGTLVTIAGTGFGTAQNGSTVSLNGTGATVVGWNDVSVVARVPSGGSSGPFSVTVNENSANSSVFTITALPSGWSDGDIGSVGVTGNDVFANGTFTVNGAGHGDWSTADQLRFVYQPLLGDGSIVARVLSVQTGGQAGVMIRETLNANAAQASSVYQSPYIYFYDRTSTGGSAGQWGSVNKALPYWVKLVRGGEFVQQLLRGRRSELDATREHADNHDGAERIHRSGSEQRKQYELGHCYFRFRVSQLGRLSSTSDYESFGNNGTSWKLGRDLWVGVWCF